MISILMCSLHCRNNQRNKLLENFFSQIGRTVTEKHDAPNYDLIRIKGIDKNVEVLVCIDGREDSTDKSGRMKVGEKRNLLIKEAKGSYHAFVDDDDDVASDYVDSLLEGEKSGCDVIVFDAVMYINGEKMYDVKYGKEYRRDNTDEENRIAYRIPNHLMLFTERITRQNRYMKLNFREDAQWAKEVRQKIQSQHQIDKILYHYYFDQEKTETQYELSIR